jgi:tRNA G26 N,N-dimethylase Trm1
MGAIKPSTNLRKGKTANTNKSPQLKQLKKTGQTHATLNPVLLSLQQVLHHALVEALLACGVKNLRLPSQINVHTIYVPATFKKATTLIRRNVNNPRNWMPEKRHAIQL